MSELDGRLRWQVDAHLCLRIGGDAREEFLLEGGAHKDGQNEAVQEVVAMNVGKR